MALIEHPPTDLATTDALAAIGDPDTMSTTAIRMSGKTLTELVDAPGRGEDLLLTIRVRVIGRGVDYPDDDESEEKPFVRTRLVNCWRAGESEPKSDAQIEAEAKAEAAKNQPPLFAVSQEQFYGDDDEPGDD
jgi:hypothetical protein